jgi:hypothetical protein
MGTCNCKDNSSSLKSKIQINKKKFKDDFIFYKNIVGESNIYLISTNVELANLNNTKIIWKNLFKKICKQIIDKDIINKFNQNDEFSHEDYIYLSEHLYKHENDKLTNCLVNGPPNNLRWSIWLGIAKSKMDMKLDCEKIYENYFNKTLSDKLTEQIQKDLTRTAPEINYFKSKEGQDKLCNLLKALAYYDPEMGYCQGVNILVANILLISDGNEVESFYMLIYIFQHLKVRDLFTRGFPKVHLLIYIIKKLLKTHLKEINDKLEELAIPDEIWLFKWIQSLFTIILNFSVSVRLWDSIIANDTDFIIKFTLAFLDLFKEDIMNCSDMVDFTEFFKNNELLNGKEKNKIAEVCNIREKLITETLNFKLKDCEINSIKEEYKNDPNIVNIYFEEGSFYSNSGKKNIETENKNINNYISSKESLSIIKLNLEDAEDKIIKCKINKPNQNTIVKSNNTLSMHNKSSPSQKVENDKQKESNILFIVR